MSRDLQNQQGYHGDRRLPKPQMSNDSVYSSDPARYDSRATNSDGWYGQRPLGGQLSYERKGQLEPVRNYRYIPPSLQTTSPYGGNTGRSVQNISHSSRSDERASERHGPTAHEAPKPRRSGGRGSEHSGERGISHPDASHASTSNRPEKPEPAYHRYSIQEELLLIECIEARMDWNEISKNVGRSYDSVKAHWYRYLCKDPLARDAVYDP